MPRASRAPLIVGLLAVLPALGGLAWLAWALEAGVDNARVEPYLYAGVAAEAIVWLIPAVTFAVLLLVTAGLVAARRPAARPVLVALALAGVPLTLWLTLEYHGLMYPVGYDVWIGPARWVGAAATGVAVLGLLATAVCLALAVTRRALARPVPPDAPVPASAPGPLRRTPWLVGAGAVLGIGSLGTALVLDSFVTGAPAVLAIFGLVAVLMAAGGIGAVVAAGIARDGRRVPARLARVGAQGLLVGQLVAACQVPETTVISLGRLAGTEAVPAWIGITVYALTAAGIVATLLGLAGLGDPRTERYIAESQARRDQWALWTGWSTPVILAPQPEPTPAPPGGWSAP
ncbi:hypothetical protein ABT369_29400 [Dactylosporangium sp. NPDC000244]|uniref:hypothetical protein n=1 Tax=Dactylosporangium sp. NPDC000244 TaxID=3154365 RepID=UPI00331CD9C4